MYDITLSSATGGLLHRKADRSNVFSALWKALSFFPRRGGGGKTMLFSWKPKPRRYERSAVPISKGLSIFSLTPSLSLALTDQSFHPAYAA